MGVSFNLFPLCLLEACVTSAASMYVCWGWVGGWGVVPGLCVDASDKETKEHLRLRTIKPFLTQLRSSTQWACLRHKIHWHLLFSICCRL